MGVASGEEALGVGCTHVDKGSRSVSGRGRGVRGEVMRLAWN